MKKFLEMIDCFNNKSIMTDAKVGDVSADFVLAACDARSFVFDKSLKFKPVTNGSTVYGLDAEVSLPFSAVSIELSDGLELEGFEGSKLVTTCVLAVEVRPMVYTVFCLTESPTGSYKEIHRFNIEEGDASVLNYYCNLINESESGTEVVNTKVKIGNGSQKTKHYIRKVVHITKDRKNYTNSGNTRDIDWTYRFEVRGHWRKIERIGKDREGNYTVSGYTWIKNFVKGSIKLPLIRKQRVLHAKRMDKIQIGSGVVGAQEIQP